MIGMGICFIGRVMVNSGFVINECRFWCFFSCNYGVINSCGVMVIYILNNMLVIVFKLFWGVVCELVFYFIVYWYFVIVVKYNKFV